MKSKPPDKSLQTSCKECLFSIYEKDTQTGCVADRINMFHDTPRGDIVIEAYDKEKEFYVIDGLCNYFRPPKWNEGQPDLEKAKKESQTSFTIIIYADEITWSLWAGLRKSIEDIDYPPDKMSIIISHDIELPVLKKKMVHSLYKFFDKELGIQTSINAYLSPERQDYEAFRKAHCSFFIKMCSHDTLPKDMMKEIDIRLNQHATRAVVFRYGDSKAISYYVFLTRFSNYKDYNEFESSVESESKSADLYCNLEG